MIKIIEIEDQQELGDYEKVASLAHRVEQFREEVEPLAARLKGRKVWMVNSTASGGGVAEMMPKQVQILRELGIDTQWAVINTDRREFFQLTKHLHNLIHGEGEPHLADSARTIFEEVNRENAMDLAKRMEPGDLLVIHDPQPVAMGPILQSEHDLQTFWRCHIGLDETNEATRAAWEFLHPYIQTYDAAVFSAPEYIPDELKEHSVVIHPAIDPLSHKNRELSPNKINGILCNGGLARPNSRMVTDDFAKQAMRLQPDGTFGPALSPEEIGFFHRPLITQVSRWDRLKGWKPLLEGFVKLKRDYLARSNGGPEKHQRRLELVRLVMAGPDPASIQDDPEGQEVLEELKKLVVDLPAELHSEVALVTLPMDSRKENALMVNAIQRCSTVVVQNSLREGFGLTATEAMWKGTGVVVSSACGLRHQVRHEREGLVIQNPADPEDVAATLHRSLEDEKLRETTGHGARKRVMNEFLIFSKLTNWLELLSKHAH